jgi:hypothetical protein
MTYLIETSRIVGNLTDKGGCWLHIFSPTEPNKLEKRGELLLVASIRKRKAEVDIAGFGKEVVTRIHERYYGNLEENCFEHLQTSLEKVIAEFAESIQLEIVAAVVLGKVLYLFGNGWGKVALFRQGKEAYILEGKGTSSGFLEADDVLCLGTAEFFAPLALGSLQAALATESVEEAAETLVPILHGHWDDAEDPVESESFGAALIAKAVLVEEETVEMKAVMSPVVEGGSSVSAILQPHWQPDKTGRINEFGLRFRVFWQQLQIPILKKDTWGRSHQTLALALGMMVILGGLAWVGAKGRQQFDRQNLAQQYFQQAQEKETFGESLIVQDPQQAKSVLLEAQDWLTKAQQTDSSKLSGADSFKQHLDGALARVLTEYSVEGKVFFDLGLIKAGASGDELTLADDQLLVLDKAQAAVYQIGLSDKKSTILAGGAFTKSVFGLVANPNGGVWLVTPDGIYANNKKVSDDKISGSQLLKAAEFSGYVYLLDIGNNEGDQGQIWKIPPTETGFGSEQKWLVDSVNLSKAKDLVIDGSIWVLTSDGKIIKLTRGVADGYTIRDLAKPLNDPVAFDTDSESSNLYILDRGNKRVLVLSKEGSYQKEYSWDGISNATDLAVSEKDKKVLLLSGDKIFEIELK